MKCRTGSDWDWLCPAFFWFWYYGNRFIFPIGFFLPNAVLIIACSISAWSRDYGQNSDSWDLPVKCSPRLRAKRRFLRFARNRKDDGRILLSQKDCWIRMRLTTLDFSRKKSQWRIVDKISAVSLVFINRRSPSEAPHCQETSSSAFCRKILMD